MSMTRFEAFCSRWRKPFYRYRRKHRSIQPHFAVRRVRPPFKAFRIRVWWLSLRYGGSGRLAPRA